jgi:hypothetical protein
MIPRLRYALRSLILAAHPSNVTAVRADATFPRSPSAGGDLVTYRIVRGPSRTQSQRVVLDLPTSLLLTFAAPVENTRIGLRLSDVARYADLGAAPSATDARDALSAVLSEAVIGPALLPGVTVADVSTEQIRLTGAAGTMWEPEAIGSGLTLTAETTQFAQCLTARARAVVELEAYSATDARGLLMEIEAALRGVAVDSVEHATGAIFERHPVGEIVNLDALAGPAWESRAVVRIAVSLRTLRAEALESIETVSILGSPFVPPDLTITDPNA